MGAWADRPGGGRGAAAGGATAPRRWVFPPVELVESAKQDDGQDAPKESLLSMLVNNVLRNPFIWGMALTYFFIYVVRQGVTSWFVFYLIKVGLCSSPVSMPAQNQY